MRDLIVERDHGYDHSFLLIVIGDLKLFDGEVLRDHVDTVMYREFFNQDEPFCLIVLPLGYATEIGGCREGQLVIVLLIVVFHSIPFNINRFHDVTKDLTIILE